MRFNFISINGTHTAILNGQVFVSSSLTNAEIDRLTSDDVTKEEILWIFNPKQQAVESYNDALKIYDDVLLNSGLFTKEQNAYYRVGIPYSIPKLLLDKYLACFTNERLTEQEDFASWDAFWLKCSLNPNPEVRKNLVWFAERWGFRITKSGDLLGYRNVKVKSKGNQELHDFVAKSYSQVKNKWKKAPKNYYVIDNDGEYLLQPCGTIANCKGIDTLQDMYDNLAELSETVYTDAYSGTFDIRIGKAVTMPREDCDHSNATCSRGLHFAAKGWLTENYFGQVCLAVIVNPYDVISIPPEDSYGKIRCCKYIPYSVVEWDNEGNIVDDFENVDILAEEGDAEFLETINKEFVGEGKIYKLEPQEMSAQVFKSIEEYQKLLQEKTIYVAQTVLGTQFAEDEDEDWLEEDDYYDEDEDY